MEQASGWPAEKLAWVWVQTQGSAGYEYTSIRTIVRQISAHATEKEAVALLALPAARFSISPKGLQLSANCSQEMRQSG